MKAKLSLNRHRQLWHLFPPPAQSQPRWISSLIRALDASVPPGTE